MITWDSGATAPNAEGARNDLHMHKSGASLRENAWPRMAGRPVLSTDSASRKGAPWMPWDRWILVAAVAVLAAAILAAAIFALAVPAEMGAVGTALPSHPPRAPVSGVLAGEFERHDALLFAWTTEMSLQQRAELASMAAAVQSSVRLMILGQDDETLQDARDTLAAQGVDAAGVRFLCLPIETPWIRDFGPRQLKSNDGTFPILDAVTEPPNSAQEKTPTEVAKVLGLDARDVVVAIDGGNLISNGDGLCLTTLYMFQQNVWQLERQPSQVVALLREGFGASHLAVLRPLNGESTGHVDMFATFTAPDTVVVGQYDPEYDPVSARTLDENAEFLSRLKTPRGLLNVVRIPMPRRRNNRWLSYTNVVFANGVLLVPAFYGDALDTDAVALVTYRKLLPGWRVVPVAAEALMQNHGGPHCATAQLFRTKEHEGLFDTDIPTDARQPGTAAYVRPTSL
jgi:agmatine/peptidylarginine deiminase